MYFCSPLEPKFVFQSLELACAPESSGYGDICLLITGHYEVIVLMGDQMRIPDSDVPSVSEPLVMCVSADS